MQQTRPAEEASSLASARQRLRCSDLPRGLRTWWPFLLLLLVAGIIRLWNLGSIPELIFDETYYVKDGYTLWREGVEMQWPDEHDAVFESGAVDTYLEAGERVVHPPLGKWLIGAGMEIGGAANPWGWRIAAALSGSLTVLMTARIGRRLFRSPGIGLIAGLLLAVDGLAIVMSRTSLLDSILVAFVVAAFGALLIDRDQHRERLAAASARLVIGAHGVIAPRFGLATGLRPWRLAAGILLGMACSVKWSGIYFLAVFGLMTVLWDWWARRAVSERRWALVGLVRDAIPAFVAMVPTALIVYVGSWTGWLVTSTGYFRDWADRHGYDGSSLGGSLRALWAYHVDSYAFHVGLSTPHPYESDPRLWLLQVRPTNFYYRGFDYGEAGCQAAECAAQILSVGNPLIWWLGAASLLVALVMGIGWRDGRAWAALSGIIAGYLPWLLYLDRTIFTFYSIVYEPWLVLCLAYALGLLIGPQSASRERRFAMSLLVAAILVLIVMVSAFFWPIWSGEVIDLRQWQWRMWLPSWP